MTFYSVWLNTLATGLDLAIGPGGAHFENQNAPDGQRSILVRQLVVNWNRFFDLLARFISCEELKKPSTRMVLY